MHACKSSVETGDVLTTNFRLLKVKPVGYQKQIYSSSGVLTAIALSLAYAGKHHHPVCMYTEASTNSNQQCLLCRNSISTHLDLLQCKAVANAHAGPCTEGHKAAQL